VKEKRRRKTGAFVKTQLGDVALFTPAAVAATTVSPAFTTLAAATAALGILTTPASLATVGGTAATPIAVTVTAALTPFGATLAAATITLRLLAADRLAHLNEPLLSILL
tara:strand:+ start:965 stop:1294 length:330 start_codon:yes stop_codon:yes gene_type:complete